MKKVAYCLFSDGLGGAENIVLQTLRYFKDNQQFYLIVNNEIAHHFSKVLTIERIINIGDIYLHKKYKVFRYILNNRFYNLRRLTIERHQNEISNFLKYNKIDILHAHLDYALYLGLKIKKEALPNLKVIFTVHSAFGFLEDTSLKPQLPFKHINFTEVDSFVFVSKYVYDVYKMHVSINEYHIIYNGIDLPILGRVEHTYNKDISAFNVLYMGGDKVVKGYDVLIESVDVLIRKLGFNNIRVYVLGPLTKDGSLVQLITSKNLNNYFEIIGYTKSDQLQEYYKKCHVLLLPSRTEAMPLAVIEAVFYNLPVVASRVGGIPEIVENAVNGYYCELSPTEFAKQLYSIATNYDSIACSTADYNVQLQSKFTLSGMCTRLLTIYQ